MSDHSLSSVREFASRYTAAWCSHDASSVANFFATQGSLTINYGVPAVGRPAITEAAQEFMNAFPDLMVYVDDIVQHGESVALHSCDTGEGLLFERATTVGRSSYPSSLYRWTGRTETTRNTGHAFPLLKVKHSN